MGEGFLQKELVGGYEGNPYFIFIRVRLVYKWTANYKDKTKLHQFNGEKENSFSDIELGKLESFEINNEKNRVVVDLTNGTFRVNDNFFEIQDFSNLNEDYRLVYFRRVTKVIGTGNVVLKEKIVSHIGYQVTIGGKNHIRLLACDDDKITFVTRK